MDGLPAVRSDHIVSRRRRVSPWPTYIPPSEARAAAIRGEYDAAVIGLGGFGSAALYWLARRFGDPAIGLERFELGITTAHRRITAGSSEAFRIDRDILRAEDPATSFLI